MREQVIEVTTFGDMLVAAALRRPDDVAVAFTDERVTAPELLERSVRMARSLHALGVRRGDQRRDRDAELHRVRGSAVRPSRSSAPSS